ncbi:hypothetical protein [Mangrovibacterium marinum]|uniref:serine O-acetyltransferase n=1 Tax=Mangrovibacterium marinum TaxID=1639118 RepID=UPI002A18A1C0|nr:hypothetical protein [Mangrovibacterium marinum]
MNEREDTYVRYIRFYITCHKKGLKRFSRFLWWINRLIFSCDIPPQVTIGKLLHLPHFGLRVVIHPASIIGNNVTIYQHVTIGAKNNEWNVVVGDNVFLGAGAKILGNINIGYNVKVGANSVVLKSLPDNCTAVGIPAKIISK